MSPKFNKIINETLNDEVTAVKWLSNESFTVWHLPTL